MEPMYYIGLDVHKRKISYCVKAGGGKVCAEGSISATRFDLDRWMKTLPQPWSAAMEATMFTGWIYGRTLRYRNLLVRQMVQMKIKISSLLMEAGVSYNKQKLHKAGYFRELLATNPDINGLLAEHTRRRLDDHPVAGKPSELFSNSRCFCASNSCKAMGLKTEHSAVECRGERIAGFDILHGQPLHN